MTNHGRVWMTLIAIAVGAPALMAQGDVKVAENKPGLLKKAKITRWIRRSPLQRRGFRKATR